MPPTTQIRIRRDTAANFTSANPTLALGEIAYETDTRNIKVGDGATAWTALGYINPYRGGTADAPTSNTVLGLDAGVALQSGATFNTLVGGRAGFEVTTGDFNVLVGYNAGSTISTTGTNVAVGTNAMQSAKGSDNVAVGHAALNASSNGTGNVAIGRDALLLNTATNSVAIGFQALDANTTGVRNTAVGKDALGACTNSDNTAVGFEALSLMQSGEYNTAIGATAGKNLTGSANTVVGGGSLISQTSGSNNIAIGASTMWTHTTGASATVGIGNEAFGYATTATNCVALGHHAGRLISTGANCTAATSTILIGQDARPSANSETNQIVIGTTGRGNGSNTTTIGNSSTTDTYLAGSVQCNHSANNYGYYRTAAAAATELFVVRGRNSSTTNESTSRMLLDAFNGTGGSSWFQSSNAVGPSAWATGSFDALFTTEQGSADLHLGSGARVKKLTIKAGGDVQVLTGNLVMSTSGKGIDFSATANSGGTMTSELLSDYEEGTWTPTLRFGGASTGITYTSRVGRYTKIGRVVHVECFMWLSSKGTSTGNVSIVSLPFNAPTDMYPVGPIRLDSITATNGGNIYSQNAEVIIGEVTDAGVNSILNDTDFANTSQIQFNITYSV